MKFNIADNGTEYLYLELTSAEMTALGFDPEKHHNIISIGADSYNTKKDGTGKTVTGVHNRAKCAVALNNFTIVDSGVVGKEHKKLCLNFKPNVSREDVETFVNANKMVVVAKLAQAEKIAESVISTIVQETAKFGRDASGSVKPLKRKQTPITENANAFGEE